MRIVYIVTSLGIGGAERQTAQLAERMVARGHAVAFVVLKDTDEEWPIATPLLRLHLTKRFLIVVRGIRVAMKFLLKFKADLLHSHTYPANMFARFLMGRMLVNNPHLLLVNTIHNVYEGGWGRMMSYRLSSGLTDHVTAVSSAAAKRYLRMGAVDERKMSVLTNGIDVGSFKANGLRRESMRNVMGVDDEFVWLAVGRIAPAKDYPNLLRAFSRVREEHSNVRLWIAGAGEVLDSDGKDARGVRLLGLRRDVVDLLDGVDGFVMSSAWEGMPLAVGEAMAMGKPVVSTDVGGVSELVGDAGALVQPKNSKALAEAMLRVMAMNCGEREALGEAARERIRRHYSMEAKVVEWEGLYERLMAHGNPP